jgi:hypothetical protein
MSDLQLDHLHTVLDYIRGQLSAVDALIDIPEYKECELGSLCDFYFAYVNQRFEISLDVIDDFKADGVSLFDYSTDSAVYHLTITDYEQECVIGNVDRLKRENAIGFYEILFHGDHRRAQSVLHDLMQLYTLDSV